MWTDTDKAQGWLALGRSLPEPEAKPMPDGRRIPEFPGWSGLDESIVAQNLLLM